MLFGYILLSIYQNALGFCVLDTPLKYKSNDVYYGPSVSKTSLRKIQLSGAIALFGVQMCFGIISHWFLAINLESLLHWIVLFNID